MFTDVGEHSDDAILEAVEKCKSKVHYRINWPDVCKQLGLDELRCLPRLKRRYNDLVTNRALKTPWTKEEDERLLGLVEKMKERLAGPSDQMKWGWVAKEFGPTRTIRQIRGHYVECLANRRGQFANRHLWTPEEDQLLMGTVERYKHHSGTAWRTVLMHFPGLTLEEVRRRYFLKRNFNKIKAELDANSAPSLPPPLILGADDTLFISDVL